MQYLPTYIIIFLIIICLIPLIIKASKQRNKLLKQQKINKKYLSHYIITATGAMLSLAILGWLLYHSNIENDSKTNNNTELIFLLDVSNSMNAQDASTNNMSRLDAAKICITSILQEIEMANYSVIIFAGNAETFVPTTTDKEFIIQKLQSLETSYLFTQGTNIEAGLKEVMNLIKPHTTNEIVILTDAEELQGNFKQNVNLITTNNDIYVIGFGSENGARIPLGNNEYLKEISGREVLTSLNIQALQAISNSYYIYPFSLNLLTKSIKQVFAHNIKNQIQNINSGKQNLSIIEGALMLILLILFFRIVRP